ncbi:unnamed protein product [Ranitomeya imitator]|uniref:Reverse transcriptase domain-containing protein n=1 Tax=Ranitomeya imitator TaxID=111125 RepID=A0ABN9MD34_9NEOB|nr:unnamed protein product [Ranitomeya imitator]
MDGLKDLDRQALRDLMELLDENENYQVKFPVIPTFYMLPKVHKSLSNPPGRPIVSGIEGLYEKSCIYLDFFLQPIILNLESYIRDSSFLIQQLDTLVVPENTILATFDVEALYMNINHDLDSLSTN